MSCVDNGEVCGLCKKKICCELVKLGGCATLEFLLGLPFAIFLLLRCAQRGCNKFLLGPFGVCVVAIGDGIREVRGCARLCAEFGKKSKIGFSCRKRRSTAMFSRLTPYDILLVTNESGAFSRRPVLFGIFVELCGCARDERARTILRKYQSFPRRRDVVLY